MKFGGLEGLDRYFQRGWRPFDVGDALVDHEEVGVDVFAHGEHLGAEVAGVRVFSREPVGVAPRG